MSGGIQADPGAIVRSGQAMVAAAHTAAGVDTAEHLSLLAVAVPGSLSATAVARVQQVWCDTVERWAEAVRQHGAALSAGGADYTCVETDVRRALGGRRPSPPTPGPLQKRGVLE